MYRTKIEESVAEHVKDYWNNRSKTYSLNNLEEMECFKRDAWKELILAQAPKKEKLRILDVGTGPGFFAINLALAGHEVYALDLSSGMLDEASRNADAYGVNVKFMQSNAEELPFEDEVFDLLVSRNVTWNLENPERALRDWRRVLKKGGRMVYFDANWYLYLCNDRIRELFNESQKKLISHIPDELTCRRMEDIAMGLPLTNKIRPNWDAEVLKKMGMNIINIDDTVGQIVWDEDEKAHYTYTDLFMVAAER